MPCHKSCNEMVLCAVELSLLEACFVPASHYGLRLGASAKPKNA